jgi:hypothetical protein
MNDEFEKFLDRLRNKNHPQYGTISWNGRTREITVTIQFDGNGVEDDATIRQRALRYLESLTREEREIINLDVSLREGKPVKAILRAGTGDLSIERLRELAARAGLEGLG